MKERKNKDILSNQTEGSDELKLISKLVPDMDVVADWTSRIVPFLGWMLFVSQSASNWPFLLTLLILLGHHLSTIVYLVVQSEVRSSLLYDHTTPLVNFCRLFRGGKFGSIRKSPLSKPDLKLGHKTKTELNPIPPSGGIGQVAKMAVADGESENFQQCTTIFPPWINLSDMDKKPYR